jgi:ornithine cyclodeaminase/alanine dehydrogenase-like protein (mu-crystallin family)
MLRFIRSEEIQTRLSPLRVYRVVKNSFISEDGGRLSPPAVWLPVGDSRVQIKPAYFQSTVVIRTAFEVGGVNQTASSRSMACYDRSSLMPLGFIEEQLLFPMRVAAQTLVAAEALMPAKPHPTITLIGAGRVANAILEMGAALDTFRSATVLIYARDPAKAESLASRFPSVRIEVSRSLAEAVHRSDVVITATAAREPFLQRSMLSPGTLVISVGGGTELETDAVLSATRLIVDDWEQASLIGDLAALIRDGKLTTNDVTASLRQAVQEPEAHRCTAAELVVAVTQGSTIADAALANELFQST